MCKFLKERDQRCYATNLSCLTIQAAIRFCAGCYKDCKIYKQLLREQPRAKRAGA